MKRIVAILPALAFATVAYAAGWDDINEFSAWTPQLTDWAHDIHPDHPANEVIVTLLPPPAELWCYPESGIEDNAENCAIHTVLMDEWVIDYLDIDPQTPSLELPPMPQSCPSSCQAYTGW